jgi:hypothetical protein
MNTYSLVRFFPDRQATIVSQTGSTYASHRCGVEVVLHCRNADHVPACAEVICGDLHAEIGLWFSDRELVDFDGAFTLPREVGEMLRSEGFQVNEDFFS